MKFSIVTPSFNAERYLPEMLESLRRQSFADWELRIVDDGSTDSTAGIIRKAAEADPRIKPLFMAENSGSCFKPRRLAIESSEGEYIVNVDADDMVEPDYLLKLDAKIAETKADLIYADMYLYEGESEPTKLIELSPDFYTGCRRGAEIFPLAVDSWRVSCVGAMKRTLARQSLLLFDREFASPTAWNAFDNENLSRLDLFLAERVAFSSARYFYRQVSGSVTHSLSPRNFGLLLSDISLCDFAERNFPADSETVILVHRQLFHHTIEFMRLLRRHSPLLKGSGVEKIVRRAHNRINFNILRGKVSPRYRALMMAGYSFSKLTLGNYGGRGR